MHTVSLLDCYTHKSVGSGTEPMQPGQEQDCFKIPKFFACKEGSLQRALHLITSTQDQEQLNRDTFFRVTNAINKRTLVEKSDVRITPLMNAAIACGREASVMAALDSVGY
ncbi:uncharacterized protein LOC119175470 [Rhipicephalus microplus]|uniref:uncharacterized protein LOC119175470 n=1 Tax=Rhipicephalus microplus TaxID=6941 RepID=UPI003F6D56D0